MKQMTYEKDNIYMLMFALEILRNVPEDHFEVLRKDGGVLIPTPKHCIRILILKIVRFRHFRPLPRNVLQCI